MSGEALPGEALPDKVVSAGPLPQYRARVRAGEIAADAGQQLAAEKLQSLYNALNHYRPAGGASGWKERLGLARRRQDPPQGLYLFGSVGTGKSMLMDLFFAGAPVAAKRRVHFHAFMGEVQERLHAQRQALKNDAGDPLSQLAGALAEEAWLLCFDEFHVVNIADAMILGRLFEHLFAAGVVIVATSNFPPDRLYEGGLQRENFLPFIDLIKQRLDLLELDGGIDYRARRLERLPVYYTPADAAAERALEEAFESLTDGASAEPEVLHRKGRRLVVPRAARGVAFFTFDALCREALGPGDYLAIARHYHSLVVSGLPRMGSEQRNEARRFMTLVDALYEHRCNLVLSAEAPAAKIYIDGVGAEEFHRTVSRLAEMATTTYIRRAHLA
jgi:cell division protein ZapE